MLSEASKALIQREILKEYGVNSRVYQDEETGDIYIKRLARVCRKPIGVNQIDYVDAKIINPKAKYGDYVELEFESNEMLDTILKNCIETTSQAEEMASAKALIVDSLKARGIVYFSLIFAKFVNKTSLGVALFKLDDMYDVVIDADKQLKNDVFEEGKEYPMIVTSFVLLDNNSKVLITASRTTSNLVEELIRLSLVSCNYKIEIKNICREPGILSKVIVDIPQLAEGTPNINPSGLVIGTKGCNIKRVEEYLCGEKVEVINYSKSTPEQIAEIIGKNELVSMFFYFQNPDEFPKGKFANTKRVLVVVKDKNIGRIIGKSGTSLKLNNRLSGWSISVVSETDFNTKYPHGMPIIDKDDFDWCDIEFSDVDKAFYGHYLTQLGLHSLTDLEGISKDDLDVKEFTDGDKETILELTNELDFEISCPECGRKVENYTVKCPYCGATFEE